MKKKFKLQFKVGKTFKDKRGWLKKILDGNFSSCIEIYSKRRFNQSKSLSQERYTFYICN